MEEHANYVKLKNDVKNGWIEDTADTASHCEKNTETPKMCFQAYFDNWFSNFCKNKFDGRKTSLSNILLTIVMEEEKTERDKRTAQLLKTLSDRKETEKLKHQQEHITMNIPNHLSPTELYSQSI
jgi:hypothetical protein